MNFTWLYSILQSHLADIHLEGSGSNFYADVAPGSDIDSSKARDIGSNLKIFYPLIYLLKGNQHNLGSKFLI